MPKFSPTVGILGNFPEVLPTTSETVRMLSSSFPGEFAETWVGVLKVFWKTNFPFCFLNVALNTFLLASTHAFWVFFLSLFIGRGAWHLVRFNLGN